MFSLKSMPLTHSRYGAKAHMEWTSNTWLPTYYRQNLVTDPHPGRVAMQNQMIGGSRLHREWYQTGRNGVLVPFGPNGNRSQCRLYTFYESQPKRRRGPNYYPVGTK